MESSLFKRLQGLLAPLPKAGGASRRSSKTGGRKKTSFAQTGPRWLSEDDVAAPEPLPEPPSAGTLRRQASFRALSRTTLLLLPVFAAFAVVLGALVLKEKGAEAPVQDAAPVPDPLADLPPRLKSELLTAETRMPAELKLTFTGNPQDLCAELADLGMVNSGWRRALFTESRWQCVSDLVHLTTSSVDYGPATLFFVLRGPDESRIDHLRLKVNVEDPAQLDIGQNAARLVIGALSDRYSWAVSEKFLEAIAGFKPLEMTDRGVRLSVAPEDPNLTGDATASQRMNIILDFGEPDFIRPADEFRKAPPFRKQNGG